tara:strand:- start:1238 stop:1738 length:501 start_codon:yes stop_codon:yes gene_type:complete
MKPVLVLDASFRPIKQVSWKKAITLYLQEKIEIIKEYEDEWIHSPSKKFKVPAVIRLINFIFKLPWGVKLTRTNLFIRDQGACQYCYKKLNKSRFTIDHVIPRSKGGKTSWENLVCSCSRCNTHKGDKSLAECGYKLKTPPVKPRTHFFMFMHGETPAAWEDFLTY